MDDRKDDVILNLPNFDEFLIIDPISPTGLRWKRQPGNAVKASEKAGGISAGGYMALQFKGRRYLVHRIIWSMYHKVPIENMDFQIDHIDGNRQNNNIENLRKATKSQNQQNKKIQRNNRSGFKGVFWDSWGQRWMARICAQGKKCTIGSFATAEAAAAAYDDAARKLHGEFAVINNAPRNKVGKAGV